MESGSGISLDYFWFFVRVEFYVSHILQYFGDEYCLRGICVVSETQVEAVVFTYDFVLRFYSL